MPIVNVYADRPRLYQIEPNVISLKQHIACQLTTPELALDENHVSIRLMQAAGAMIGEIELEILAYCFEERVRRQDEICTSIRTFVEEKVGKANVRVWLILSEMGYSYNRNQPIR